MADAVTPPSSNTGDLASLASLTPLIINLLKGSSQPNPGALLGTIPGGQDLLNGVVGQQAQQAPLRQGITQQAMNMLPNSAFPGGRPALAPVGAGAAPVAGGDSGMSSLLSSPVLGSSMGLALLALSKTGLLQKLFPSMGGPSGGSGSSPNDPNFVGPQQPGTNPSNVGGPGDLSNVDPNGLVLTGDQIGQWIRQGGGTGQSDRAHDQQDTSAATVGYI